MADNDKWQRVGGVSADAWKPEKENDSVEGMYVDVQDNVGPNGSKLYTLQQEDGTFVAVWGSAVIDSRMEAIPLGDQVRIVYLGTAPSKIAGRKPTKMFDIFRKPAEDSAPSTTTDEEAVESEDIPF